MLTSSMPMDEGPSKNRGCLRTFLWIQCIGCILLISGLFLNIYVSKNERHALIFQQSEHVASQTNELGNGNVIQYEPAGIDYSLVAELIGKVVPQHMEHLVETDRSGLVAEYVGQTAVKTNKIIDSALDGILFIDEAYSLVDGGNSDYGKAAISTLLKRMEDDRERLVVILAGYTDDMKRFIDSNPGLQSRFNRYIEFPDYSADELFQIFESSSKNMNIR